jgi:hypothetical protein
MGFGTWLVRSSNSREGNQQLFLATCGWGAAAGSHRIKGVRTVGVASSSARGGRGMRLVYQLPTSMSPDPNGTVEVVKSVKETTKRCFRISACGFGRTLLHRQCSVIRCTSGLRRLAAKTHIMLSLLRQRCLSVCQSGFMTTTVPFSPDPFDFSGKALL